MGRNNSRMTRAVYVARGAVLRQRRLNAVAADRARAIGRPVRSAVLPAAAVVPARGRAGGES